MSKHILLIGGNSGIGLALTKRLIDEGQDVTAICRTKKMIPEPVSFFEADVAQFDTPLPSITKPCDGIVYLPGSINLKPFKQLSIEAFQSDLHINLLSAIRVIQHYLPQLKASDNPNIVLISSVAASVGLPYHTSVSSSKAAVEGLILSLAAELAPKIRVNGVAPSITETPLSESLLDTQVKKEHAAKRHPLQQIGSPEDIAETINFLLSDAARWITGQIMHVDGGFSTIKSV